MMRAFVLVLLTTQIAHAQHSLGGAGPYDPAIPPPRAVLGYEIGERFTAHHLLLKYAETLATASPRVALDTVAHTFEGREVLMAIITSEANQQRLEQIRRDAQRIADPRGASQSELSQIVARMPSIVWLGYTVHGGEASGAEAALAFMYQLAAGQDPQTRMILDSTVVLIDPLQNPDGHERHVHDVQRARGALGIPISPFAMIHQGSWPGPRTTHYYFDINRDWYVQSHPETRGRVASMLEWYPHVAVDLHEMGSSSTYFFPPPMDPVNKNVHPSIIAWWDIYAAANAAAFDARGWPFFRREGYDEFYPGYGSSWPLYHGAVGMTYEQASSSGGAIRRSDGTIMTLREAALHHYTTSYATSLTTAQRRYERVRDFLSYRQSAITDGERSTMRAVIIERDAQGRADSLAQLLQRGGVIVLQLAAATDLRGATSFGTTPARTRVAAGSYVVDMAQPAGRLARALLEPDAQLDSVFIREELERRETAQGNRFYDMTAWALPYVFRVNAWSSRTVPGGLQPAQIGRAAPVTLPAARHAYAFETGTEPSIQLLSLLLADSVRVHLAQRWFRIGENSFPQGAFLVRINANDARVHEKVQRQAAVSGARVVALNSGAVSEGTDIGSNSVIPVRPPRVALVGGDGIGGNSFGYSWYTLDQRMKFPVTTIEASSLGGAALDEFNVVIVPSAGTGLNGTLGESGRNRLGDWVRAGGVLITLDGATAWLATEQLGLARLRARRDTTRADNEPGAPFPATVPGAIVRVLADTLSVLTAGIAERELPALVFSDRIYQTPRDFRPGEIVLRYGAENRVRISGYMWPEVPARLADSPYLWTERVGRGRVIGFAGDPNFRDMWRGLLPLFANAVLLGGSF